MTTEEVKDILGVTTTKHDTYFNTVVPLFDEAAKDYCNNSFLNDDGVEELPGGVKVAIAKWCEYNMNKAGLKHWTMGEVNYIYDTTIPDSIKDLLKRHRRLKFT
jgi:hypothetical protein